MRMGIHESADVCLLGWQPSRRLLRGVSEFLCVRRSPVAPTIGRVTVSDGWCWRQAETLALRLFLGSIEAPVPSSRPGIVRATRAGGVKSAAACGGARAAPRPRLAAGLARHPH